MLTLTVLWLLPMKSVCLCMLVLFCVFVYRHVHGLVHQLVAGERGAQGEGAAEVGRGGEWRKLRAGVGRSEETHTHTHTHTHIHTHRVQTYYNQYPAQESRIQSLLSPLFLPVKRLGRRRDVQAERGGVRHQVHVRLQPLHVHVSNTCSH